MNRLKTYERSLTAPNIVSLEGETPAVILSPGDWVRDLYVPGSVGILVAVNEQTLSVLWSKYPNERVTTDGQKYIETGFVFAPYVPLIVTPTIIEPEDFVLTGKGTATRYSKKLIRSDFYGTVNVDGLASGSR